MQHPGALRTWLELYEPLTEAPSEAHLGAAIALISAAIGWKATIRWGENDEPCTVNVILEGRSATARKTTVAGSANSLAREAMKNVHEDARALRTRSISHTSGRGLLEIVAPKDTAQAEAWEAAPQTVPGTLLVWDEFGNVLGDPSDLKGSGWLGQVRGTVMQLANGRHGGLQTGADKVPPARCAVSILGTMTRVELEQRVSYGLLRDGFLGRFLLMPFGDRTRLLASPPSWTSDMRIQRDALVDWLKALAQSEFQIGDVFKAFTDDARDLRSEWYGGWVGRLDKGAADGSEGSVAAAEAFGRLQTTAVKIAVVAACAEWDPTTPLSDVRLNVEHVAYGHGLAELALAEIISLGETSGMPARDAYAEKVKRLLARSGGNLTRKKLLDNCRANGLSRSDRWKVVENLYPDDVDIVKVDTGGRPGFIVALQRDVIAVNGANGAAERNGSEASADTYAGTSADGKDRP